MKPALPINKLVLVQPMSRPSELIFYMDYHYGESPKKNPFRRTKVKTRVCSNG